MKRSFFQAVVVSITAIWMHYMDANKTNGEKSWRQLHKNAASITEQVQEGNTPQISRYTATYHQSWKLWKLDEPNMQDTAGEVGTSL